MSRESLSSTADGPCENTDRELWREREGDFYSDSIHVTKEGAIGISVGATVITMSLQDWFDAGNRSGWNLMDSAPSDGTNFLAVVDGEVRQVVWGKTSHVPLFGWIYADQGEETDLCSPTYWMPMPRPPRQQLRKDFLGSTPQQEQRGSPMIGEGG